MNNPDISHILNNPELKDLMGNIFKSINQNIKKTMDTDQDDEDDHLEDNIDKFHTSNIIEEDLTDLEEVENYLEENEKEMDYKKEIDIKKKYFDKDPSDSNLIDMLLYLFLDRNGNNIADILSDLSSNIAENNQLIQHKIATRNNILSQKPSSFNSNSNNEVIELD